MKGTSRVIMGATLVMVVSIAIVVGLILVLFVELYCSLLLRRRQLQMTPSNAADEAATTNDSSSSQPIQARETSALPSLSDFYAHGVIDAPRSFLFPAVYSHDKQTKAKEHSQFPRVFESNSQKINHSPRQVGLLFTPPRTPPPVETVDAPTSCSTASKEHFIYISNPIYDNNETGGRESVADTPYETPDSSPSCLENAGGLTGEDDYYSKEKNILPSTSASSPCSPSSVPATPPLTPMKKLPAEACSVSLRDARSVIGGISGSDSYSNHGLSSSSSGSPCTSPSW